MPLDSAPKATDDLSDIDITKPLSITSLKRILHAAWDAGLLAMDHPHSFRNIRLTPYMTPHRALDAFLGVNRSDSCPCRFAGRARRFLSKIDQLHDTILLYRSVAYDHPLLARTEQQFEQMLEG